MERRMLNWRRENKYSIWYDALMKKARMRNLKKPYERHHVWPISCGGDRKSETVKLTFREHFLAHWLLTKFVFGLNKYRMLFALAMMSNERSGRRLCSSWQYVVARRSFAKAHRDWWSCLSSKEKEERRRVLSEQIKRQRLDPEFLQAQSSAVSKSAKIQWEDPEFSKKVREALGKANKKRWGEVQSDYERAEAWSEQAAKNARTGWENPEVRKRQIAARKIVFKEPEYAKANSERAKKQWDDPNFRILMNDPEFLKKRGRAAAGANRKRVWTPEMTAKRVAKFKAYWDAKRGAPKP